MKVLAIDPGYDRLGLAIIEKKIGKEELIYSECFQTESTDIFHTRLGMIGSRVRELVKTYTPDALAIEDLFFAKNTKTALKVSESRGVVIFQAVDAGLPVYEYTPNQIKVAVTGYGKATKREVHIMVNKLIHLDDKKRLDDEIDAIATGLTFFASYKNAHL
ncbi:MAG: crossover junction endodeoxyribonuclease RuvC [Candidatus Paceibacteria bacterium]|jgi:crossover junction endodeoxyribonuclease RuvC